MARNRNQLWLDEAEIILLKGYWIIHRMARIAEESDLGPSQAPSEVTADKHS